MSLRTTVTLFTLLFAGSLVAQTATPGTVETKPVGSVRSIYQPVGAPADPKVDVRWNVYHDYKASTEILQRLAAAHPQRARLQSLGRSTDGREMWVITITNFNSGKESEKSGFWIDAGIHANEVQATEVALYTAWYLLENYGRNDRLTQLVDQRVFYIMPMLSPDSRDAHFYEANTTHSPRTGKRPVDDDQDGRVDEDRADDLDNDGHITQMRVADPNGRFKPHPDFPELLIPVKADERGSYTLLGAEGIDNDRDGKVNEDGDGSYDPNRDWPWNWQPKHVQNGAFRYPFSLRENRLTGDFIKAHPNIAGAQSYHNTGGMILRGPGAKDDRYDPVDLQVYDLIGKQGETVLPGYRYINIAQDLYEVYGGSVDWLYQMNGVFTFTNELFTPFNFQRKADGEAFFPKDELTRTFDRDVLFNDGFVKWHKVKHPQFGEIEVGGVKKSWVRQPPSFLLEEECHRNMAFTLLHAEHMPRVNVQSVTLKPVAGSSLTEVTAVVINERITPTHAAVDIRQRITPPDVVTLSGPGIQRIVTSQWDEDLFFRNPKLVKREPATVKLPNIPGQGTRYIRWYIEGTGPVTVNLRSVKGGVAEKRSE
jgi:hypothetical protein